ncbi:hypothetical protein D3C76_320190 [compost metagenome]
MLLFEGILAALPEVEDRGHVHLVEGGQHRRSLLRLDEAACDRQPSARHALALDGFAVLLRRRASRRRFRRSRLGSRRQSAWRSGPRPGCAVVLHIGRSDPADRVAGADLAEVDAPLPRKLARPRRSQGRRASRRYFRCGGNSWRRCQWSGRDGRFAAHSCGFRLAAVSGLRRCCAGRAGTDDADRFADGHILAGLAQDGGDDAVLLRTDLQVDLVGLQLSQHIPLADRVALFYQPFVDGSFGNGFTQIGYFNFGHRPLPPQIE